MSPCQDNLRSGSLPCQDIFRERVGSSLGARLSDQSGAGHTSRLGDSGVVLSSQEIPSGSLYMCAKDEHIRASSDVIHPLSLSNASPDLHSFTSTLHDSTLDIHGAMCRLERRQVKGWRDSAGKRDDRYTRLRPKPQ